MARSHSRVSLQIKVISALFALVALPIVVSVILIGQMTEVAADFSAAEARGSIDALDKATGTYRELFETTKRLQAEIADRIAKKKELRDLDPKMDVDKMLVEESRLEPSLRAIRVIKPDGSDLAYAHRDKSGANVRDKSVEQTLGDSGARLQLTFEVSATLQAELQQLKVSLDASRRIAEIRETELPTGYRNTFLMLMAAFLVAAGLVGWWASTRFITNPIESLVKTARTVSQGKYEARAALRGGSEMAELGRAFDQMLDDLDAARGQLQYLQRMGVWQDVARRLAHEIKNPLTPIQLAVQQCVSQYKGDDPRYKRLLTDTGEIVEEEIEGLRRLVDTFRTLGALPKVEKAPVALASLIEDLRLDPQMASRLELEPPATPVTVRADKLLLKRVLANLVENGIHAGQDNGADGKDGKVVVSWRADRAADAVIVTVDDHGKGVAEGSREKIFEPYVTTKATGTGLGLAIARKICIEHGGELSVAPERAPTGGARFVVSLPLRAADQSLAP